MRGAVVTELLGALAFAIMIGAHFLAVVAVHRIREVRQTSADALDTPRVGDHDLHVLAERIGVSAP